MDAALLSMIGAASIAIVSAAFGVGMARVLWAEDLEHALRLRAIWDKTEIHYKGTIESLENTIQILKRRLGER